jgi:hypothetical protein
MNSSWQMKAGHLVCRWSEFGSRVSYNPHWMQEASDIQGSYLPPVTDFASHSPFGLPSGSFVMIRTASTNQPAD